MANQSAKRIKEQAVSTKKSHTTAYALILAFTLIYRIFYSYYSKFDIFWLLTINITTFVIYFQLNTPGLDLSQQGGLVSFYFDVLYIGWFVMPMSIFSSKFYWLLVLIPIFAMIKIKSMVTSLFGTKEVPKKKR